MKQREESFSWIESIGSNAVLLAFFAQVSATLYLVVRRAFIAGILFSPVDIHALACCLGGIAIALSLFAIQFFQDRGLIIRSGIVKDSPQSDVQSVCIALAGLFLYVIWGIEIAQGPRLKDDPAQMSYVAVLSLFYIIALTPLVLLMQYFSEMPRLKLTIFTTISRALDSIFQYAIWTAPGWTIIMFVKWGFDPNFSTAWWCYDPLSDRLWVY